MHKFARVAWYVFDKNKNEILHHLVYLKLSGNILLILMAIKVAFQHLFVPFSSKIALFFIS